VNIISVWCRKPDLRIVQTRRTIFIWFFPGGGTRRFFQNFSRGGAKSSEICFFTT